MKKLLRTVVAFVLTVCLLPISCLALSVEDAKELLNAYYIDTLPLEAQQAKTLDELFAALKDPYTVYMTQEEHEQFLAGMEDAQLVGIGVSIQNHENGVMIISVLDRSPALEAGLTAGDIIQKVNGTAIRTTDEASALIIGQEGTSVQITVLRADGSVVEFTLIRRTVVIPTSVQYALSADENAGVIVCSSFGDSTRSYFMKALLALDDSVNAWIVDLTSNPGGTDTAAAGSAGWFIGGETMVYFRDGQDQYRYIYTSPLTPVLTEKPAVILTGPYSASGAELFSAAIRDHGAGIAVGQRTFGKGVAQVLLSQNQFPELFNGDAMKITVYRFFSPVGTTNDQLGLLPTVLVSPENTYLAALLLCADVPESPSGYLKLNLAGWDFYIDLSTALSAQYLPAFVELLNGFIPTTPLWMDDGSGQWAAATVDCVSQDLGLAGLVHPPFTDLENCAQADAIRTLAAYGLVSGDGTGAFHPEQGLTRAELCAMLANLLNLDTSPIKTSRFSDVEHDAWYAPAVHAVCERGFMNTYSDQVFQPDMLVTQQDLINTLAKVAVFLNMHAYDLSKTQPTYADLAPYAGFNIHTRQSAHILGSLGLDLSGLNSYAGATRGIAADLIFQLMRQTNLLWQ